MGARFVSVDRETPMQVRPDLRDWGPEDDRVPYVIVAAPPPGRRVDRETCANSDRLLGNRFLRSRLLKALELGKVGVQNHQRVGRQECDSGRRLSAA
jgi:hypothetical protein